MKSKAPLKETWVGFVFLYGPAVVHIPDALN